MSETLEDVCLFDASRVFDLLSVPDADADGLLERLERYARAKDRAVAMRDFLRDQPGEKAFKSRVRLGDCGNYLLFRNYFTVGQLTLHAACFCKQHLICPLCAIRRGSKTLCAYLERFEIIRAERPELAPWMITFTVKNGPDLAERMKHLKGSFQRLQDRRRSFNKGLRGASWTEFVRVEGAVGSYEVTNQRRGQHWHPHIHMVAMCATGPQQQPLRDEWERITGDSFMVDVRPFLAGQDPALGFMEVLKYAVKFGSLSIPDNWEAAQVLAGSRLLFSLGVFRGVQVPEVLTDEPIEDLPYFELFYRYFRGEFGRPGAYLVQSPDSKPSKW